jgi:phosphate transport system permease protein
VTALETAPEELDRPRRIAENPSPVDRTFRGVARAIGASVLVITGSIGLFLGYQSIPTLRHYGLHFFTETQWEPERDIVGIASVLVGTFTIASVALAIALPLAFLTALYISEYAPARLRPALVALIDLMAAVPSIVWGLWGKFLLSDQASQVAYFLRANFGWVPFFHVDGGPHEAIWQQSNYYGSAFIAGIAVSMMVLPMACAVMREVFAKAPLGEREAAYALGATRWAMIRAVVLPFARGGIIGGSMLALGRALGETIAVLLIISQVFDLKFRPLETGTNSVSALIAGLAPSATTGQLSALLAAGFILFMITLVVNTLSSIVVNRSRSGAGTDA